MYYTPELTWVFSKYVIPNEIQIKKQIVFKFLHQTSDEFIYILGIHISML